MTRMLRDARSDAHDAEQIRSAVAREVHELGIAVVVVGASRRVVLNGNVATEARRAQIATIARGVMPDFEIQNGIRVTAMAPPRREELR